MQTVMDVKQIMNVLPHRHPFLLVDRIIEIDRANRSIVGIKNVTMNEAFFQGHFPGQPIMPGVLIIEALAQTCGVLALQEEGREGKLAFFASIKEAKFRKPVVPGDQLRLEAVVTNNRTRIITAKGTAKVDGEVVAEAEMMFGIMGEQGK